MIKRQTMGAALAVALALVAGSAWPAANECGRVGTWYGATPAGLTWLGTDTPGTSATTGQLSLEWVTVTPNFYNYGVNRLTGARGVWEKVKQGLYEFSWVAYGISSTAPFAPVYKIRVSGMITHADCDHADLSYTIEFFIPPSNPNPVVMPAGTGTETRMLMP